MSNKIPAGWEIKTIGDIGSVVTGSTPSTTEPSYWNGEIPFISPADFDGKVFLRQTSRTLTAEGVKKARLLPKESILVTCIGSLGGMAMTSKPSVTNQQINAVIVKKSEKSLFHFYNILFNMHELIRSAGTTTLPIINKTAFSQIDLLVPPLPEQQKIATILSSVDNVIEKTRAQIDKLKDLKTGMMQELLTKGIGHTEFKDSPVGRIPAEWDVVNVGSLTDVIDPQPDHRTPAEVIGGIPYVGLGDIDKSGLINFSAARKVSQEAFEKQKEGFEIYPGAFIFGKIGTIGQPYVLPAERFYCLSANVVLVTTNNHMRMKYLFHVFCSGIIDQQVLLETNTTSQPALGIKKVRDFLVPYPRQLEEVELITEVLSSLDNRISKVNDKLAHQLDLKKALMQDLLTGKVRVNVNDKESAAV